MSNEYGNMRTADIVAEALLDWKVDFIFGLSLFTTYWMAAEFRNLPFVINSLSEDREHVRSI